MISIQKKLLKAPKKVNIKSLVISSIIPFLILGPFIPDLIVSLSSLIFIIYVVKHKEYRFFNNKYLIFFFIFSLYFIICSLFSDNIFLSFESSLFYFRVGIFSCVIWYLIEKEKKILNYFYFILVLSFLALVIDGYIQFFVGKNILGLPRHEHRISSFFGNEYIMGSYLSRLFPLLFAFFLIKKKEKFEKYLIAITFVLVEILIYLSGERAAFAFLNISTFFIIVLIKEYKKLRILSLLSSMILIFLLTMSSQTLKERMIINPIKSMNLDSEKGFQIFSVFHDSSIKTAYKMFLDKPISGHGPKMFRVKCKNTAYQIGIAPCTTHPHNFYVQLLAETGVIGVCFLFGIFILVIFVAFKQIRSIINNDKKRFISDYQVCLLAAVLITVWPIAPNGNFFNNWLMIVYSLPVGFLLHSIYGKNKRIVSIVK